MAELLLTEENHVKTYLVQDSKYGPAVIKKVLDISNPSEKQIRDFASEFNLLKDLKVPGIRKPVILEKEAEKDVAFYEYFEGLTLKKIIQANRTDLHFAIEVGIFLAQALVELHAKGIIHKSINSHNVLYNADKQDFCLIDFSHASTFTEKKHLLGNPSYIAGDLAYISPEQTGRMNRRVDARSDLYSLGIVLYEMLSGEPPFSHKDPIEVVHGHIARKPDFDSFKSSTPKVFVQIVEKLLQKDAESRYQSGLGLKYDLEKCRDNLKGNSVISSFKIGTRDFPTELRISQRLYGRSEEIQLLNAEFKKVANGGSSSLMVTGYSGVGKTALIYEVYKSISRAKGYFIKGKYDQLQKNIPYYAINQALSEYVGFLLTEPEDLINRVKEGVKKALGNEGRLITDLVPSFSLVIGEQPEVEELSAQEAQNRFIYIFLKLMRSLTETGNPVVMFIDDLQWADLASLRLISNLLSASNLNSFLFVGSYRDNEVSEAHPLKTTLDDLGKNSVPMRTVKLQGLEVNNITELLEDSLSATGKEVKELAAIIHQRTLGNAFYVNQILNDLYEGGHLRMDGSTGHWKWDNEYLEKLKISDNVIDLLISRVKRLDEGTQKMLQTASCIGNVFDREQLKIILDPEDLDIERSVIKALEQELIEEKEEHCAFTHDRIQQALYSMIDPASVGPIHLTIGRTLLNQKQGEDQGFFDIVDQLNAGKDFVESDADKLKYASLNLKAGIRAKSSTAYDSSLGYFNAALHFIKSDWNKYYEMLLSLHTNAAEVSYLSGEMEGVEHHSKLVIQYSKSLLDKIPVYKITVDALKSQNRLTEAVQKGLEVLSLLGINMPFKPSKVRVLTKLIYVKIVLRGRDPGKFLGLKNMRDPYKLASMQILVSIGPAIYWASPNLIPLTIFNMLLLSIRNGNTDESTFAYSTYGLLLCGITGEIKSGNKYGSLALALSEKVNLPNRVKATFNVYCFVHHWQHPLKESFTSFRENFQLGLETGDLEFAALSAYLFCNHSFYSGKNLEKLDKDFEIYCQEIRQIKQHTPLNYALLHWQAVKCLTGGTKDVTSFNGPVYDENEKLEKHKMAGDHTALFKYFLLKQMLCYLFHQYEEALDFAEKGNVYLEAVTGMYVTTAYEFYYGLSLAGYVKKKGLRSGKEMGLLRQKVRKFKKWGIHSPENNSHKYHLLAAELASIRGHHASAQRNFSLAVDKSGKHGFKQDEALSNELAGQYYKRLGNDPLGDYFLFQSYLAYQNWGASSKAMEILGTYKLDEYFEKHLSGISQLSGSGSNESALQEIDIGSVIKASTTISQEIEFENLKKKLMQILVENVGAERGVLLIPDGEKLKVEKQWPDSDATGYAGSVVTLVHKTGEWVVSGNAREDQKFGNDPHIVNEEVKSLLCFPIINQGELIAILYLENNLAFRAFGPERMEILKLLSGQIAISLKNAALYRNLGESYKEQVKLKDAYSRFLPRDFLNFLGKESVIDLELGDQVKKEVTIMFIDIKDYTSISEKMSPKQNFNFINECLRRVGPVIKEKGGFICQYMGDGLMAIFKEEPAKALEAAVLIQKEVYNFNFKKDENTSIRVNAGIGMHIGKVMLGIIGDESRMDQNVISDNVNIASRVQDLTRYFGSHIMVTRQMIENIPSVKSDFRRLGKVRVKGKLHEIEVYEHLEGFNSDQEGLRRETKEQFDEGLNLFYAKEFSSAAVKFEQVIQLNPDDKAARGFLERAAINMTRGVPDDWTGVDIMEHK